MPNKKAFVFDTNFIIENLNLKEVVANLSEEFTVYVTQVSIDERISQKYLELKNKYDKLLALTDDYKGIANIRIIAPLDKKFEAEKEITQKGYIDLFGKNIIPFASDKVTFSKRVYKKTPPFLSADGASITIKDNSYYKSLFKAKEPETVSLKKDAPLPDVNQLREKVSNVIYSLCGVESRDYWGNPDWDRTFTLSEKVDTSYMEYVFTHLKEDIRDNLFESAIPADKILGLDDRITNGVPIPMSSLEDALSLYEEIRQKLPDYLPQFYSAAATIINGNYVEPQVISSEEDDLPF